MTTEPLDLDTARKTAKHKHEPVDAEVFGTICNFCNEQWPRDAAELQAEVDRLAAELATMRERELRVRDLAANWQARGVSMAEFATTAPDDVQEELTDAAADWRMRAWNIRAALAGEGATEQPQCHFRSADSNDGYCRCAKPAGHEGDHNCEHGYR